MNLRYAWAVPVFCMYLSARIVEAGLGHVALIILVTRENCGGCTSVELENRKSRFRREPGCCSSHKDPPKMEIHALSDAISKRHRSHRGNLGPFHLHEKSLKTSTSIFANVLAHIERVALV